MELSSIGLLFSAICVVAGEECIWPTCMPHCVPCAKTQVGTCLTQSFFGSLGACHSWKGPTDCFMGKCLCQDGYCAEANDEVCKPQVCVPGAGPPPFEPNGWLRFFSSMSSLQHFPEYELMMADYMAYVWQVAPVPLMLLILGILLSFCTCACLFCGGSGYHYKMNFGLTESNGIREFDRGSPRHPDVNDDEFSRRAWDRKPWCLPMFVTAAAILGLCVFGGITRQVNYAIMERNILSALERAEANAVEIANASLEINVTISHLEVKLIEMPSTCKTDPNTKQILNNFVASVMGEIQQYIREINHYAGVIQPIPVEIHKLKKFMLQYHNLFVYLPVAPLAVVAVICMLIVVEAAATTCCKSSSLARCVDFGLKLAALVLGLVVLVVAVLVFVETLLAIVLSKFCEDVDENTLRYVNSTTMNISDMIPRIAEYYIRGSFDNPIEDYDNLVMNYINHIEDYYNKASIAVAGLRLVCPAFFDLDVNEVARKAREIMERARLLLKGDNIYPYYLKVVREGICNNIIASTGWIWLLQVLVGLVLFPLCAILTHRFLVAWAAWQKIKELHNLQSSDSDGSEEDDEDPDTPKRHFLKPWS